MIQESCTHLILKKTFGLVLFLKTFNSEFSYIKIWFTDQNSKPLKYNIINIILVSN